MIRLAGMRLPGNGWHVRARPATVQVARIEERRGDRREVARTHRRRRHGEVVQDRLVVDVALEVRHEEHSVLEDRTGRRVTVLVPRELRLWGGGLGGREGVRTRVELVVAVELEHGAAECVRPRLGDDVHLAGGAPELR